MTDFDGERFMIYVRLLAARKKLVNDNRVQGRRSRKLLGGCKFARDRILKNCVKAHVTLYGSAIQELNNSNWDWILVSARQTKPQNSPFCAMFQEQHKTVPFMIGQSVGCSYNYRIVIFLNLVCGQ